MKSTIIRCLPLTITLIASAAAQSLQDGLIAYYDFEEAGAAGIANKAPGATDHDGVYLGDITSIAGAGAGFAGDAVYPGAVATNTSNRSILLAGNALNVAKANTSVSAGKGQFAVSSLGTAALGDNFTVSSWFHAARDADNTSTSGNIIRSFVFEAANNYDISWGSGNNNTYTPYLGQVSGTSSALADNQWHHVLHTVTSDGTTSTLNSYVNGVLSATITAPTNVVDFSGINFGAHRGAGRIFDGLIDEVAIWDRAMDETEVAAVYTLGAAGLPLIEEDDGSFLFWDTNGVTPGAGGVAPSGSWADANWSADLLGESATAAWAAGSTAVFSAGDDATGTFTVALDGTHEASEIRVQGGDVTLQGGSLELTGAALLRVLGDSGLTVSSPISATGLTTRGDVTLQSAATIPGPLAAIGGTLTLDDAFSFGGLNGNGTLDLTTGSLTLDPQAATTAEFSGVLAGNGGIVKSGEGIQIFNRTNDGFGGGFTVEEGMLVLAGEKTHPGTTLATGGMLVADGRFAGELSVGAGASLSIGSAPGGNSRATLVLEALENTLDGALVVDLNATNQTPGEGFNDLVEILEDVTFGAASMITPRFSGGLPDPTAVYEIVWVDGIRSGLPTVDPAFQARTRYQFETRPGSSFIDDVELAITGGTPEFLLWAGDGIDNVWDVGVTQNWRIGPTPSAFLLPDHVEFDDTGDNSLPILITEEILPSSIVVDTETKDYLFAGDGVIIGDGGLDKYGSAELTLLNRNEFTGQVRIFGGGITVGDGTTTGTLGGVGDIEVSSGAALTFDRSDSLNLGRRVIGGGTLAQTGTGTLRTGQAGNNYDLDVASGTFQISEGAWATSYFSTAGRDITVRDGATLLTTGSHALGGLGGAFFRPNITIEQGGTWQLNNEQYMNAGGITLAGGTILQTGVDLRLQTGSMQIEASDSGSLITRTGTGRVTLFASPTFDVASGPAVVDFEISAPIAQSGSHGFTKAGDGLMVISGDNTFGGGVTIAGGTLAVGNGSDTGTLGGGPVVNNASLEINRDDEATFTNVISGTGELAIKGGGTITLSGANTYTGDTTVEDGTLVLGVSGQLAFALDGISTNTFNGPGAAQFNGTFNINLAAADASDGNSWLLAPVANRSFGSTFTITSNAGSFAKAGTLHTLIADGLTWTFNETTATLAVNTDTVIADGASLKLVNGTEAGTDTLTVDGGNLWLGDAVEVDNDIVLVGPAASNVFGGTLPIDYLLVGGGGGGGARDSSGGGGGGAVVSSLSTPGFSPFPVAPGEVMSLLVGDGGAGGVGPDGGGTTRGQPGQPSQIGSFVAPGGGGGGGYASTGGTGASGGGGGRNSAGGTGTPGLGFNGGAGAGGTTTSHPGGGGGGAGFAGEQGVLSVKGGDGGNGIAVAMVPLALATDLNLGEISGTDVFFGGGGGGTGHRSPTTLAPGIGGLGGGGTGADRFTAPPAVAPNTGGGGGAARSDSANTAISSGAKGGSGVVIVRYPGSAMATGGADTRTLEGFTYQTFTAAGGATLEFGTIAGTASATITSTLSGTGGFTWQSSGTLTLAAANSYSGDTVVDVGTLSLQQATLADGSSVFLNGGATLDLVHGETDTVATLWINGVQQPAGSYNSANSSGAITGSGALLVTNGPGAPTGFAAWIDGFFPGETDPAIIAPDADANGDGVANALVYLLGGDPKDGNNLTLLPTATLVTNPGGTVPDGGYLVFTHRRDATAQANPTVEHSTTLEAPWTIATDGVDGVVVIETTDGFAPGIDRVEVFIPQQANPHLFGRLAVTIP